MKNRQLFTLLSIAVIFVFITSLFTTVNVLADDNTPPAPTEEPALPPTEEPAAETESAPTSIPEADPSETPEVDTPAEVIESAPEGVDVVVLDENGEPMSLVTEEAAEIIMSGDPIWCPENVTPGNDSLSQCTPAYTDLASLIDDLANGLTGTYVGNGTIYIASDYSASEGGIIIDHTAGNLSGLGNLVIQGGWDLNTLSGTYNQLIGNSTLDGTWLLIDNWAGNITVNNIFINNSDYDGLYINTEGDVSLDYVDVNNSDRSGVYVESGGDVTVTNSEFTGNGIEGYYYSDVDTTEYIADPGLFIAADGDVTLNNVSAVGNGDSGVDIESGGDVEITNSDFNDNGLDGYYYWESDAYEIYMAGDGVSVCADGDITLGDVYATGNGGNGASLCSGGDVDVTESIFSENGWGEDDGYGADWQYYENEYGYSTEIYGGNGLTVHAFDDITINNIESTENAGNGAELYAEGDITITDSMFGHPEGGGNGDLGHFYISNDFEDDGDDFSADFYLEYHAGNGLIAEAGGSITLAEIFAAGNANTGAELDADLGNVSITDSEFSYNGWYAGFFDDEDGYSYLEDYMEDFCDEIGSYNSFVFNPCDDSDYIYVQAPNFHFDVNVTDDSDEFGNSYYINQYGGTGLDVESDNGSIALNGVEAIENGGDGAYLESQDGVTVIDSYFIENGDAGYLRVGEGFNETEEYGSGGGGVGFEYGNGLTINSAGNVTLSLVGAHANSFHGVDVNTGGSLFVEESDFISNGEFVSVGGEGGLFGEFLCDEISLCSDMELPVSGFDLEMGFFGSEDESGSGMWLDFGSGSGLFGSADGNITIVDVLAADNLGFGVDIYSGSNINVSESGFYANGYGLFGEMYFEETDDYYESSSYITNGSGLYAFAENDVTLNDVEANGNVMHGAEIYSGAVNSVFVEDSEFNSNGYDGALGDGFWSESYYYEDSDDYIDEYDDGYGSGLYIESDGNVTLVNVDANGNYQDGAEIYSNGGRVIVSCGQYNGNGYGGSDGYGIYEDGASSLELYGPEILGNYNSPDEYFFSGSLVLSDDCTIPADEEEEKDPKPGLPINIIPVTGGFDCAIFSGTLLLLPNGDNALFPCPIQDEGKIELVSNDALPGSLPEGNEFISAFTTFLFKDGKVQETSEESIIISFMIPDDADKEGLSILYWNGSEWTDLGGTVSADGLYFQVPTNLIGTFVLVSK